MKTRKNNRTLVPKKHQSNSRDLKPLHKIINDGALTSEEDLAEKHSSPDEDWKPARKSKGADEEG
jgi:hypothetical protein